MHHGHAPCSAPALSAPNAKLRDAGRIPVQEVGSGYGAGSDGYRVLASSHAAQ